MFHRRKQDRRKQPNSWWENCVTMAIVLLVTAVWVMFLVDLANRISP